MPTTSRRQRHGLTKQHRTNRREAAWFNVKQVYPQCGQRARLAFVGVVAAGLIFRPVILRTASPERHTHLQATLRGVDFVLVAASKRKL